VGPQRLYVVFVTGWVSVRVTVWDAPAIVAVITTVCALELCVEAALAVAVKTALVADAGTVTLAGIVSAVELSERETLIPPEGAVPLRATVQLLVAPGARLAGLHCREEMVMAAGAVRAIEACAELPLSPAVMVAVWLVVAVPALAVNVAVVDPALTLTDAEESVSRVLLLETETVAPPEGAAPLRVTVQLLVAPDARLAGLHCREDTRVGASRFSCAVWEIPP
jgi:hypothetical protein